MASFTLRLGNLDLSDYTRVAQGDGLDPLDSGGFNDPQFSDSVLAEGQPLVYVSQGNREMQFPLYLKAASKDALAALLRSINQEIETTSPLRIEWKDQGATDSTFYDVTFARFDPDYNYRRAGQNWLGGILHVWAAPPYGHTGTTRIIATGVGSGAALRIPIPSSTLGDVDSQMRVQIRQSAATSIDGNQVAVAVLPNPSWNPIIGASQFLAPVLGSVSYFSATVAVATGAPGGVAYSVKVPYFDHSVVNQPTTPVSSQDVAFSFALGASVYSGDMRVLAAVRASERRGMQLQLMDENGDAVSSPVTATGWAGYSIVDLGRITMPSSIDGATKSWSVGLSNKPMFKVSNAPSMRHNTAPHDPYGAQIAQLYVLPEDKMQLFLDTPRVPYADACFIGNTEQFGLGGGLMTTPFTDAYGNNWNPSYLWANGSGAGYTKFAAVASGQSAAQLYSTQESINDFVLEVELDQYTFLNPNSSFQAYQKPTGQWIKAELGDVAGGAYLNLEAVVNNAAVTLASVGFVAPPSSALAIVMYRWRKQGPVSTVSAEWFGYANATGGQSTATLLASLSASHSAHQMTGGFMFQQLTNGATTDNNQMPMFSFRMEGLPSYAQVASGVFDIDGTRKTAQYKNAAGSYLRQMYNQRGAFQTLSAPSPAAVFVLQQGIDSASAQTSAVISVRERFTYVR